MTLSFFPMASARQSLAIKGGGIVAYCIIGCIYSIDDGIAYWHHGIGYTDYA